MKMISIEKELKENSYPGRGIIVGRSEDGTKAVIAYFIIGIKKGMICRNIGSSDSWILHER